MREPVIMEDTGDGFPLFYDPETRENFYVSASGNKRMRFAADAPPKYAATCKLCAMANLAPPRGTKTSLSPCGRTLTLFGPNGEREPVPTNDPARFRLACELLHRNAR